MNELAVRFGRYGHLVGVLTAPDESQISAQKIAVVIPNAGFVHHIGPFRLHVYLARLLAQRGVATFRFDLSGLGDSDVSPGREPIAVRKQADIADAVAFLKAQVPEAKTALVGLCSGASDAHNAALELGQQIAAVAMLDPVAYPDRYYPIIRLLDHITSPKRLMSFILRKVRQSSISKHSKQSSSPPAAHDANAAASFAGQLQTTTTRGIRYLFVYTGGREYNHRRQLFNILTPETPRELISVLHYPQCDHTFVLLAHRNMVCEAVSTWIGQLSPEHSSAD